MTQFIPMLNWGANLSLSYKNKTTHQKINVTNKNTIIFIPMLNWGANLSFTVLFEFFTVFIRQS